MRTVNILLAAVMLGCATAGLEAAKRTVLATDVASKEIPRIALDGVRLDRAIRRCRELTGAKIVVDWKALKAVGVTRRSIVKVVGKKLTFAKVLDLTLAKIKGAKAPLGWAIYSNSFLITSQAELLKVRRLQGIIAASSRIRIRPGSRARPAAPARPQPGLRRAVIDKLEFDEAPLEDVLDVLGKASGMNMVVNWKSLEAVGVDKNAPVTLSVRRVSMGKALDLVLDSFSSDKETLDRLHWVLDEKVITVATGAVLNRGLTTRIYNVADLLVVRRDFSAPKISGFGHRSDDDDDDDDYDDDDDDDDEEDELSTAEKRRQLEETLIAVVQGLVGPEWWQPLGKGSIRIWRGQMIISQSKLGFRLMEKALPAPTAPVRR